MHKNKIVSIIGTGVIGTGWAARFVASGYYVQAYDPNPKSLKKLKVDVKKALTSLKKIGLNDNASIKNLSLFSNLNDALNKMLKRENRIDLYHQCLKFLNTRVNLDLECFPDDIWSH